MNFDFPTILVLATLITGVLWALDVWLWAPKRRARADALAREPGSDPQMVERAGKEPVIIEYARSFFPIILLVLLVRSFVVEPFRIPSGSMMPTLLVGDFILVNKFSYGLRLPVLNTKIVDFGAPEQGDIVVFRYPENPHVDYIKRVVGVPGDHIVYRDKTLLVNGEPAAQQLIGSYIGDGAGAIMTGASLRQEKLGDTEHQILVLPGSHDGSFEFTVPANEFFVMGDNRDNSRDSRYWGTVPEENLVGKAFFIWMNWDASGSGVTWSRIGDVIE